LLSKLLWNTNDKTFSLRERKLDYIQLQTSDKVLS